MKTKLTLTIDPRVTHSAKQVAKKNGVSLSSMVEKVLAEATGLSHPSETSSSFSQRWRGQMQLKENDSLRAQKLRAKHGLSQNS
jgi:hypothetical protein